MAPITKYSTVGQGLMARLEQEFTTKRARPFYRASTYLQYAPTDFVDLDNI
jgi:hypothetical protein